MGGDLDSGILALGVALFRDHRLRAVLELLVVPVGITIVDLVKETIHVTIVGRTIMDLAIQFLECSRIYVKIFSIKLKIYVKYMVLKNLTKVVYSTTY